MKVPAEEVKKIAVLRALQLGDLLCSIPATRALRHAYPAAEIYLLGLPWAQSFTSRFNAYFNGFILFPGYPGLPEQPVNAIQTVDFIKQMQEQRFDLILQMQGNGSYVNSMVTLMAGRYTAGFCSEEHYCPDPRYYLLYPDKLHEIKRHTALMAFLGIPSAGLALEFPLTPADYSDLEAAAFTPQSPYVCIHPGSRASYRQWDTGHFAAIADLCIATGHSVVLTGTAGEQAVVENVQSKMHSQAIIAAGKTSLGGMAVLLKGSRLLVSNCTGVSHLAAALEVPSVVLSMDGEPGRWAPLNMHLHHTLDWTRDPDLNKVREWVIHALAGSSGN